MPLFSRQLSENQYTCRGPAPLQALPVLCTLVSEAIAESMGMREYENDKTS